MGMNNVRVEVRVLGNLLVVRYPSEEHSICEPIRLLQLLLLLLLLKEGLSVLSALVMDQLWLDRGRIADVLARGGIAV